MALMLKEKENIEERLNAKNIDIQASMFNCTRAWVFILRFGIFIMHRTLNQHIRYCTLIIQSLISLQFI